MANYRTSSQKLPNLLEYIIDKRVDQAGWEAEGRSIRAANELRTATMKVLRGQRSGRRYIIPGTGRKRSLKLKSGQQGVIYNKGLHTARIVSKSTSWIEHKYYTASAPGEPPAVRTGIFRASWKSREYIDGRNGNDRVIHGVVESDYKVGGKYLLGELLENGTSRIAPRPYKQRVIDMAYPKVLKIYREPYF